MSSKSFWLCRIVLLRYIGFIYFIAFTVAFTQNESLIGPNGLTPATKYIERVSSQYGGSSVDIFLKVPTLFLFISPSTQNLDIVAVVGMFISLFIIAYGKANSIMMVVLWIFYMSLVNIGQTWYSFGWESQLLEVGFIAIFVVQFLRINQFNHLSPMPKICIWGYRWLLFRIMFGAGMIKIRGDECWRNLTCMYYHYLTQPVPNPLSTYLHHLPRYVHNLETLGNHIVELVCPFMLLIPSSTIQIYGGVIQIVFQIILILSGNLSFLNWLTILPAICCFDDTFYQHIFTLQNVEKAATAQQKFNQFNSYIYNFFKATFIGRHVTMWNISNRNTEEEDCSNVGSDSLHINQVIVSLRRIIYAAILSVIIISGSVPVMYNMLSRNQSMNASFGPFRLVNSYGAFGSVTKTRHEVIIQGALVNTTYLDIIQNNVEWKDYDFNCKPGDINRRPCAVSPFHYRLDWLLWFAAFQNYQQCPWLIHLMYKLLQNDKLAMKVLHKHGNPYGDYDWRGDDTKALYIRAMLYEYQYSESCSGQELEVCTYADEPNGWEYGKWWNRKVVSVYVPPLSITNDSLLQYLSQYGWYSTSLD